MNPADWTFETLVDPTSGETLRIRKHRTGLTLLHIPKPGFTRKFAGFAIPYGSVHTGFESWAPDDPADVRGHLRHVPAGTAHYLEHCVFTRDDQGGLLSAMSSIGAQANAYTTHSHTLYYFTTADSFEKGFGLMLEAVLNPHLDSERVEAERPVILSELAMYLDEPDARSYTGLVEGLFTSHPVRADIGGDASSVASIGTDDLHVVHECFYCPGRLTIAVSGDFDADSLLPILSAAAERFPSTPRTRPIFVEEPAEAFYRKTVVHMDVGMPSFLVGIRDPDVCGATPLSGRALVTRRREGRLVFETLLGSASKVFDDLYAEGLLTDSFGFHYLCEKDFAFLAAGGESPEPEKAASELLVRLRAAWSAGIDAKAFDTQRKAAAGGFLRGLDSVESCGISALHAALDGIGLFDYPDIYDSMFLEQAASWTRFILDEALDCTAIVLPVEGE